MQNSSPELQRWLAGLQPPPVMPSAAPRRTQRRTTRLASIHEERSSDDSSPGPSGSHTNPEINNTPDHQRTTNHYVSRGLRMTDLWPQHWGAYNEPPDRDSLTGAALPAALEARAASAISGGTENSHHSIFGLCRRDIMNRQEPYSELWKVLSGVYGQVILLLMLALCLIEAMDNSVAPLSLQGLYLMYLYVGSIGVIICIYVWVLIDSCTALSRDPRRHLHDPDLDAVTGRFGSLKRAHISRERTSRTSFYLRLGALAFGLGTLVFNGLEIAMHSTMDGPCLNDTVFAHPVLHALFTFLQMHFLFVNSEVVVEKLGLIARFGFMHLAATNLAQWLRLVVWESAAEWSYYVYLVRKGDGVLSTLSPSPLLQLRGYPQAMARVVRDLGDILVPQSTIINSSYAPVSEEHLRQVVALHECLNTNALGRLWTSSMPFLFPFIVEFSLIAAAVTFIMGRGVGGRSTQNKAKLSKTRSSNDETLRRECHGASKGLFLGLLCIVGGVVVLIVFFVVRESPEYQQHVFWLASATLAIFLVLGTIISFVGILRIKRLTRVPAASSSLDNLLAYASFGGALMYGIFGAVVGGGALSGQDPRAIMVLTVSLLLILQVALQAGLIAEAQKRGCSTRQQCTDYPGRQMITALMLLNAILWLFDSFVTHSWVAQELQLSFLGLLAWGVVARVSLPLLIFYRFHSCVLLAGIWRNAYKPSINN